MEMRAIAGRRLEKTDLSPLSKYFLAGCVAGVATTVFACPGERIMTLGHMQQKGFIHVIQNIGITEVYRGWRVTLCRDIVFNAFLFTIRDLLVDLWESKSGQKRTNFQRYLAGLPAGDYDECTHTTLH